MSGVRNARDTLRAGFTTVRDVGTFRAFVDVALRDAIDRGWTPGPRMQCAGAYITCPGGGGEVTGDAPAMGLPDDLRFGVVRDADEVRARVRALAAGGADRHQVHRDRRGADPRHAAGRRRARPSRWSRRPSRRRHGTGCSSPRTPTAPRASRSRSGPGVRSVEHGSLIDDEGIAMLVANGTYLVADVYDGDWIAEEGVAPAGRPRRWPRTS